MAGAGAWKTPPYYKRGMKYPTDPYQQQRVRWAVIGIQNELIRRGHLDKPAKPLDGGIGTGTDAAIKAFQKQAGLLDDGLFGRKTSEAIWRDWFTWYQALNGIPDNILLGMCRLESGLDPGAEGIVAPADRGIAQFNRTWWPMVDDEMAFSQPTECIKLAAANLSAARAKYGSWDLAIAAHNNPSKAAAWKRTGVAPDEQIQRYVELVRTAAAA